MLDEGLRSGLFLAGMRRTGKTTFLRTDLVPELEARGAVVVYVDLWSETRANPAAWVFTSLSSSSTRRTGRHHPGRDHQPGGGSEPRPDTPGHFLLLDQAYVRHVLQRLAAEGMALLPS